MSNATEVPIEKMNLPDLPTNLTVEEFGLFVRRSRTSVYRMIKARTIVAIQVGGAFIIPRAEVARILSAQS